MRILKLDLLDDKIIKQIISIEKESYQIEADLIGFQGIPGLSDTKEKLQNCLETFYGYFTDDTLVGIISVEHKCLKLDICRLAISPNFFKQGIATELINHIENLYNRVERITVTTGKDNIPAINLYKSLDFELIKNFTVEETLVLSEFQKEL